MSQLVVYVDRSEVRAGKLGELEQVIGDLFDRAAENERLLAYDAYLSADRSSMTVIHVHPDSASLERHMKAIAPVLPRLTGLVRLLRIDIYGAPSEAVQQQLRRKASMLGAATVTVHDHWAGVRANVAGFS